MCASDDAEGVVLHRDEHAVLALMSYGFTSHEVSTRLNRQVAWVHQCLRRAVIATSARSKLEAITVAARAGLDLTRTFL